MNITDEADIIAMHALASERNLRMAAKVAVAFDVVKQRIVSEFLAALAQGLTTLGKTWEIEDEWSAKPLARDTYIALKRRVWSGNACIGLHCDKVGPSDLNLFVYVEPRVLKKAKRAPALKSALDERYAHGRTSQHNPWWQYVEPPYRNWNNEGMLVQLYQKTEAVEYFARQIGTIAKIATPFVNRILK